MGVKETRGKSIYVSLFLLWAQASLEERAPDRSHSLSMSSEPLVDLDTDGIVGGCQSAEVFVRRDN